MLNQQEHRTFKDIADELKDLNKNVKDLTSTIKSQNSKTNQNTMMARLTKAVEDLADVLKKNDN